MISCGRAWSDNESRYYNERERARAQHLSSMLELSRRIQFGAFVSSFSLFIYVFSSDLICSNEFVEIKQMKVVQ